MKFNRINKIILFGGSRLTAELVDFISQKSNFQLIVFTAERHLNEGVRKNGETLKQILEKRKIKYCVAVDINTDVNLKNEVTENTLGIALGAAWVFEPKTVKLFSENHLLDFMGIDLPRYRGGAHYTWQILHQNRKGCANLQVIYGGEETFHRGDIVKRLEYRLSETLKKPIDFFEYIVPRELKFIASFLGEVRRGKEFNLRRLDENKSSYYPFLYTAQSGLIDWSWNGKDLFLFISAFDDPYLGASTFCGEKRVFLKDAEILKAEEKYHPFTSGIVVRKNKDGIYVATVGNLLKLGRVLDEAERDIKDEVKLGDRFYTPAVELDKSRKFNAVYGSRGLKK